MNIVCFSEFPVAIHLVVDFQTLSNSWNLQSFGLISRSKWPVLAIVLIMLPRQTFQLTFTLDNTSQ